MLASRATFWRLSAAMGAATIAQTTLGTAVPLFAVAIGLAPVWVGVLVALPNALPVVMAVRAGRLVDLGGAGTWLVVGAAGVLAAPLLLVAAPGTPALAVAQASLGVFQLFQALSAQSLIADLGGGRVLERNYASYATLLSAGRLVGPLLAGTVIDVAGFRAAFGVAAVAAAVTLVGSWSIRRGPARATEVARTDATTEDAARAAPDDVADRAVAPSAPDGPEAGHRPARSRGRTGGGLEPFRLRAAWANVGVQLAVYSSAGVFVAISVRQAFLPVALTDLGYPATAVGALVSIGALASVAVRPFMPFFTRTFGGPARTLIAAMVAVAVAVGLLGLVRSFAAFAALGVLAGFGTGVGLPLSIVTVASHVAPRQRGAALGLRLSLNRAAQLVMPVAMGAVIGVAGFAIGFGIAGLALAALTVLVWRKVPTFERTAPVDADD